MIPHSPDTPTPGQLCYEAFDAAYPADRFVRLTWDEQAPAVQAAWEAAAQAVQDRVMQDLLAGGASAREERRAR